MVVTPLERMNGKWLSQDKIQELLKEHSSLNTQTKFLFYIQIQCENTRDKDPIYRKECLGGKERGGGEAKVRPSKNKVKSSVSPKLR